MKGNVAAVVVGGGVFVALLIWAAPGEPSGTFLALFAFAVYAIALVAMGRDGQFS